jgi:hypothetical protein
MISLTEAAEHFARAAERCRPELEGLVETVTVRAGMFAKSYIGHVHDDWPVLSTATVFGFRHESGRWIPPKSPNGGFDYPLLRTGQGRDSIDILVTGLIGEVGSDDKALLYSEIGTPMARYPNPPRPVFAKAVMEASEDVLEMGGELLIKLLVPV